MNKEEITEWIFRAEKENSERKVNYDMDRLKHQSRMDLINSISSVLAIQTQAIIIGSLCGGSNDKGDL